MDDILQYIKEGGHEGIHALETPQGKRTVELGGDKVCIDMGAPAVHPDYVPVVHKGQICIDHPVTADGREARITCLRLAEPFCVTESDNEAIEKLSIFPQGITLVTVTFTARDALLVTTKGNVYRAACAALCAAVLLGRADTTAAVTANGETYLILWNRMNNRFYLTAKREQILKGGTEL